ncbi:MAG: carboxypeptidase-like regulatory domain-containing protein, partial [Salinibacter sp.]
MITGTVVGANTGEPLPGANVVIPGTEYGTATDKSGSYVLEVEPGTYTVEASFVGYQTSTRESVDVEAGGTVQVDFQLASTQQALDEVVVVGYGEQQRTEVTGSVSQVSASAVEDVGVASASAALQGQAGGVMVQRTGTPGSEPEVRVRGLTTLNSNDPLYV